MSIWDELEQKSPQSSGGSTIWDEIETGISAKPTPTKPAKRGVLGAANDYVIEAANAVLGGAKSIVDFAQPGTELASRIEALVREGEEKQSDVAKRAKQELGQSIEEGGMEALKGVGKYVVQSPGLAISQAIGSFVAPGAAIKGAGLLGRATGAGERAIAAGRAAGPLRAADEAALAARGVRPYEMTAGVASGAALSGGDAAGDAYQQVYESQINLGVNPDEAKRLATEAARKASIVPAVIGGVTGILGAEAQLFSGAKRSGSSILKSAGSEALQEAVEEGSTKLSANLAAMQYGVDTTPMRGVVGAAALGGALGGITGGGVAFATRRQSGSLLQASNDNLTGNLTPDDDGIKSAINEDRQMSLFSAEELMPQVVARESELINPYNVGGYVGAQQAGLDTGLQFTSTGGQQNMVFGAGPVQQIQTGTGQAAAPAAQATQPQAQPTASGQQAPQIDPQILSETGQRYGLTQSQMPGTGAAVVNIGGRNVYGTNSVKQFLTELTIADEGKSDIQRQLEAAVFKSGTMSVQPTVTAKAMSAAATKQLEKLQINEADSLETAAQILNDQIRALGDANKKATDKNVETLARTYEALTGSVSPAFTQILEGATNVQNGQKQQVSTGVGAVSVGGGAPAGGTGLNVQPTNVQSQQPGSQPSGQNIVQNVPGGEGGARLGGGGPVSTNVSSGSEVAPSQVTEGTPTEKEEFAKKLFIDVFGERDGLIVYDLLEVTGNQSVIAAKYDIDRTVVSKIKNKYFESNTGTQSKALWFKPKYQAALKNEIVAQNISLKDVYKFLSSTSEAQKEMEDLIVKDFEVETAVEGAEDTTPTSAEEQGATAPAMGEGLLEDKTDTKADERDTNLTFVGSEKGLSQTSDVSEKSNWRSSIKKNRKNLKNVSDAHLQDAAMAALEGKVDDKTLLEDITAELKRRETVARASKAGRETVETQEEEDAVQESSAEKVDVRKQAGDGRAVAKRDTEKQAVAEEDEVSDELATREEDAEDAWNSLVTSKEVEALGLAEWVELSEAQQALVLRLDDPSTLTLRNVEKILALEDDTRTIDVEAREVSPGERRMIENGIKQLPNTQVATLEKHYGAKSGTAEFISKLATDVTNYINKGAESVAAAIRGIIKSMAEGMVAFGLVFNPAIQYSGFDYNVEAIYEKAKEQKTQVPANAKAKMSPLAQAVYRDMAATAKKTGKGFMIADKQAGMIHAFNADGSLLVQDSALFGKDIGDKVTTSSFQGGPKITPAGKFTIKVSKDESYAGGYVLGMEETYDAGEGSWVAIHAAYLGNTGEKRLERLASGDAKEKRVSYGCINTTHDTFLNKFKPNLDKFDGGMVFVLPEEAVNIAAAKTGKVQFSKKVAAGGSKASDVRKKLRNFIGAENEARMQVYQSIDEIPVEIQKKVEKASGEAITSNTQGFIVDRKAYLIADNISPGTERAVFMHEVGSHLGLENILTEEQFDKLVDTLLEWSGRQDDSLECTLATKALVRVIDANSTDAQRNSEMVAYFIEEAMLAGVNPKAVAEGTGFASWFRTLWSAFKQGIRRLNLFNPDKMNATDIINMAYGAARLEIAGTWHGTAAEFRRFNHMYMSTGEGAQAYGWGTYLAQRFGIAYEYMTSDVSRKTRTEFTWQNPEAVQAYFENHPLVNTKAKDKIYDLNTQELLVQKGYPIEPEDLARMYVSGHGYYYAGGTLDPLWVPVTVNGKKYTTKDLQWSEKQIKPAGTMLRVDVNAKQDELLNWDISLAKQPSILNKLEKVFTEELEVNYGLRSWITNQITKSLNFSDLTGQELYLTLQEIIKNYNLARYYKQDISLEQMFFIDAIEENAALKVQKYETDEVVSTFLNGIGIKGLKFLDARSRKKSKSFYIQKLEEAESIIEDFEAWDGKTPRSYPSWAKNTETQAAYIADLKYKLSQAPEDSELTRNLVVFSDKNIVRVASLQGGNQQEVKFSIRPLDRGAVERNIRKLPSGLQGPTRSTFISLANFARKGMDYVAFTPVIIDRAVKAGLTAANKYLRLNQERGQMAKQMEEDVQRIVDMYANVPAENRGTGDRSVNRYIFDSTRRGVWGFQPTNRSDKVDVDPELSIRFKRLSPEAQAFIRAVFKHGDDMLALKKKTVMEFTNSEYDAAIEQAKKDGDAKLEASLTADKKADLKKFDSLFKLREGIPYAPIKRIGKYVVIAKSAEYRQAERDGDTKKLRDLEKDPDHYHVTFKDTEAQARALQQSLVDEGHFGGDEAVEIGERDQYENELYGGNNILQALTKLRSQIDARASSEKADERAGAATMRRIVTDLYLESLAEASARKNEMRRKGVSGEVDMLQSFGLQGAADARFLSALQYDKQTQDAIQEMRGQVRTGGGDRLRKSELYNELMARYAQTLDFEPMPVTQKLNRLTSVWFLATSPGYYLQNLTQPYMMSLPLMAAKHEIGKSSTALFKAYTELGEVFKSAKLFEQQFDYSKVPADVRQAIKTLVDRGRIDIGIDTELGNARIEGAGAFEDRWNKVDKGLRLAVQKVEILNRLSTAIAAYRLEMAKSGSAAKALQYADDILVDTHGDYSAFAAPRAFNTNIGKIALQFRKFQLIQLSLMAKLIKDAYTGKDRAVAVKALTYILGNTAVMAGVLGLPGMSAIAWILGQLLGDDDEPFILEKELREYIGDEDLANIITRGVPTVAGADLSGKIGMGNMLSVLPFTEIDKLNGEKTAEIIGTLIAGPAGGLLARGADGVAYMANGDYWKGLELMTPKGVGDAMKAYRIANEGVTNNRGDVLLPPEELGDLDTIWRAFGLSPVKQTVRSAKQGFKIDYEAKYEAQSGEIKRDYIRAVKENDNEAKEEARQKWKKLQEARKRNGFKVQPLSELLTSPREQRKRERKTTGGVQFDTGSRRFVEGLQ